MSEWLLRTGRCMLIAALFFVVGGHWVVMQTIAWGRMVVAYSQTASVGEALQKTFDGEHPCEMCKKVAHGQQSEKKSESVVVMQKVELYFEARPEFIAPLAETWVLAVADACRDSRTEQPSVPPPRPALV